MAGHTRTTATGAARRTAAGKARKVRTHLPPGEAEQAKRRKEHRGARTVAADRINRESVPLYQLDIAREYVRSAAAKYAADKETEEITVLVQALLAMGDRIYQTGQPLSAAAKRARREAARARREKQRENELLIQEGRASVRRQQKDARQVS